MSFNLADISVQFSSVTHLCPTLCDPMNHNMPGLSVHHQLPEFTQTQVHQVGDVIQSSSHLILCHPLLLLPSIPPSIRVFSKVNSLHETFGTVQNICQTYGLHQKVVEIWFYPKCP